MTLASGASPRQTTGSMKPQNITAGTAGRRIMHDMSYMKPANAAGTNVIVGGMKTATAGTRIAIGTIAITTTATTAINSLQDDREGASL
jgi:hypothetical protein